MMMMSSQPSYLFNRPHIVRQLWEVERGRESERVSCGGRTTCLFGPYVVKST